MENQENELETKKNFRFNPQFKYPLAILLLIAVFFAGVGIGKTDISISSGKLQINKGTLAQNADYQLLWDALDQINAKYVERPLDQQKLLYGAVAGLVNATGDPYTVFFNPEESKQFAEELEGSFEGVGMEVGYKNNQIVVISPLEGTPAFNAGILPGDSVLAIDSQPTAGMTVDQAVSKIRGRAGTEVILTILHKGKTDAQDIKITRSRIEIKSIKFETKQIDGSNPAVGTSKTIGIIKLNRFGDDTKGLLDHTIDVILSGNYSGLVLDLRNNPGGYLEVAVLTASNWVEPGDVVVKEVALNDKVSEFTAKGFPRLAGLPSVVLVNDGSASASEIVAGALQDYGLATLVGEKTFGKGSVQELVDLRGNATLKITIAKWQTPKGRDINKNGLEPDVKVERTVEDFENDRDPQMDKALELLR